MNFRQLTRKLSSKSRKKKILIITENRHFSHILNAITSKYYFQINTLSDPFEAKQFINREFFLVIVDDSTVVLSENEREEITKKVPQISFLDCSSNMIDGEQVPNPFKNITKLKLQIYEVIENISIVSN